MKLRNKEDEVWGKETIASPSTEFNLGKEFVEGFEAGINEEPDMEPVDIFEPKKGVIANCTSVYVRSAAHVNSTPIDTLPKGTIVTIIGEEGDFWQLESPEGYTMKKFIEVK